MTCPLCGVTPEHDRYQQGLFTAAVQSTFGCQCATGYGFSECPGEAGSKARKNYTKQMKAIKKKNDPKEFCLICRHSDNGFVQNKGPCLYCCYDGGTKNNYGSPK